MFIGKHQIPGKTFVVAEIGINHNGSIDTAKKLIDAATYSGCNAVKLQKRTVDVVYSQEELARPRESPFGQTNGDLKRGLEFAKEQYDQIDAYCKEKGVLWFASCWDEESVDFISQYNPPAWKIAAACLTDNELLKYTREKSHGVPIFLSTGMSTETEVALAVEIIGKENLVLMHCRSTYPADLNELNLQCIHRLRQKFNVPVGYSGHESGIYTTLCAVAMGAVAIERHITLDRSMWGSDQAASVEPGGFKKLCDEINNFERAYGDGVIRCYPSEVPVKAKLRRK